MATNHPEREAVARIIDPSEWAGAGPNYHGRTSSLAKADAILAAIDAHRESVSVGHEALIEASDLETPFTECFIYTEAADLLTYLTQDAVTVSRQLSRGLDVLLDAKTREPLGFQVWGAKDAITRSGILADALEAATREGGAKPMQAQIADMIHATPPPPATGAGWRTIDSAPRDGTRVCLAAEDEPGRWRFWTSYWRKYLEPYGEGFGALYHEPTHWMPLPAPTTDPRVDGDE